MPAEAFTQMQEEAKRKEQNKLSNKFRNINGNAPGNNNTNATIYGGNPNIEMEQNQGHGYNLREEDDFVVDYHYGDSISNDEEVARISAATSEERTLNVISEEENRNMAVHIADKNVFCNEGSLQEKSRTESTRSSGSYYPSSNSEFSTPSVEEHSSMKKVSPICYKITETPPLPKFDALPPMNISTAFAMGTSQGNQLLPNPDGSKIRVSSSKDGLPPRKRYLSDTSLPFKRTMDNAAFSKKSAFDPISNFRITSINKNQPEVNGTNGVKISASSTNVASLSISIPTITSGHMNTQLRPIGPQHISIQNGSNNINKPSFSLASSGNNRKTFVVQSIQSNSGLTPILTDQAAQKLIIKESNPSNRNRIIVSHQASPHGQDQAKANLTGGHHQETMKHNDKPLFSTSEVVSNPASGNFLPSSNQQPKQALLAQINGRQVLLIPKQEESLQKPSIPSTITSQMFSKVVTNTFASPQYKIIRNMPAPNLQTSPGSESIVTQNMSIVKEDDEPSKLERCLRYGSAAVDMSLTSSPNVSLPYYDHNNSIKGFDSNHIQSTPLPNREAFSKEENLNDRPFLNARSRESIESMRRDSSDSGKSDIITSSTIDAKLLPKEQLMSHSLSYLIPSQGTNSYQMFNPPNLSHTEGTEINELQGGLDPHNSLSISSDSGFIEQSPNVTPQLINFPSNSSNSYLESSSQYK